MKRNTFNFWIDLISLLVMFGLTITGLFIHFILPPGSGGRGGGAGLTLWGLGRHDYGDFHFYLAITLILLMLVHVWLHWPWVYATLTNILDSKKREVTSGKKTCVIVGLIFLCVMIVATVLCFFLAKSQVQTTPGTDSSHQEYTLSPDLSRLGQKSLAQVSELTGVPVEKFIEGLHLPPDVDTTERLGRLRQKYNFQMNTIRTIADQPDHDH